MKEKECEIKLMNNSLAVLTAITVRYKDNRVTRGLAVGISLSYKTCIIGHTHVYIFCQRETHTQILIIIHECKIFGIINWVLTSQNTPSLASFQNRDFPHKLRKKIEIDKYTEREKEKAFFALRKYDPLLVSKSLLYSFLFSTFLFA